MHLHPENRAARVRPHRAVCPPSPCFAWLTFIGIFLTLIQPTKAEAWRTIFGHDIDVITVTDLTATGRTYPTATSSQPVYYTLVDLGQQSLDNSYEGSRGWAGEIIPPKKAARQWLMSALAEQGYRLASHDHPPTQLLVYCWGMVRGTDNATMGGDGETIENPTRPALKFLGGDKVNLMWEQEFHGGFVDAQVLRRGFQRMGVAGKIWDFSGGNLFIGRVRSFTMESLESPQTTLLWETRFACPADGLALADSLPMMIKAAAPNFGRETVKPVNVNASKAFNGRVNLGELNVLETIPDDATNRNFQKSDKLPEPAR